jgi:chromosome segregation ATPase
MASTHEFALQARLNRAEAGWGNEIAAHERTPDELHVVSRDLRNARSRIEALEKLLESERVGRRKDIGKLGEELGIEQEYTIRREAECKERDERQLGIINQLRAEIDESASTLQSVLEHQNDIRDERDAAIKRLEGIQANDDQMRKLREQVASRIEQAEEEVRVERAKVAAAEAMREMSIKEIKTLRDIASETAAKHAAELAKAIALANGDASREELKATKEKLRKSNKEVAKLQKDTRGQSRQIHKLKNECTTHKADKDNLRAETERMRRELAALRDPPQEPARHLATPVNHYGWDRPAPMLAPVNNRFGSAPLVNVKVERHDGW